MATVADRNHRDYKLNILSYKKKADLRKVKTHNQGVQTPVNKKKQDQGNYHKTSQGPNELP